MVEPIRILTQEESWHGEVSQDVIRTLEGMLKRAQSGEIHGVAIAFTTVEVKANFVWSKLDRVSLLIGAVERLKFNLLLQEEK